ncbi:MAG: class I SAM-dependent methyltransferase [Proteobacteria bacterium]|nr:class I SAM-dependent methyltransferase [Pseudomonadota bacterium]
MNIWHRFIHPITYHFRRKRGRFLLTRFLNIRNYKICDLGGSRHFWEKLNLDIPPEQITIFNVSHGETSSIVGGAEDSIRVVLYDGKHIPVEGGAFDLLVCNSVMEHVLPEQRVALVSEMRRVAKRVFCQTPAYEFPVEPHFVFPFIHWLPRWLGFHLAKITPWRLLSRPSTANLRSYWWDTQLLTGREVRALFPNAEILTERVLGLTKSYYIIEQSQNDD